MVLLSDFLEPPRPAEAWAPGQEDEHVPAQAGQAGSRARRGEPLPLAVGASRGQRAAVSHMHLPFAVAQRHRPLPLALHAPVQGAKSPAGLNMPGAAALSPACSRCARLPRETCRARTVRQNPPPIRAPFGTAGGTDPGHLAASLPALGS